MKFILKNLKTPYKRHYLQMTTIPYPLYYHQMLLIYNLIYLLIAFGVVILFLFHNNYLI